jgi:hypothetical protein
LLGDTQTYRIAHTDTHTQIKDIHTGLHKHTDTYTHICIWLKTHTQNYIQTQTFHRITYTYTQLKAYIQDYTHTHTHIHVEIQMHVHTVKDIHTGFSFAYFFLSFKIYLFILCMGVHCSCLLWLALLAQSLLAPAQDLFIIYKYIVADFRSTRRGRPILLQMVVSHHVVAGI